jgi:peptidoglycan/LPS O-acetylase OafA/YrhL
MNAIAEITEPLPATHPTRIPHIRVLDGWRGLSILLVLAAHLLPLGPSRFGLNEAAGITGMAIFFTLSGFLITSTLYFRPNVRNFLIRRVCRIVPVAWLFVLITLPFLHLNKSFWPASLLFYANLPPFHLVALTGHLWSLCVEIQFYALIALLFAVFRKRAFALLPFLTLALTLNDIRAHEPHSIVTWFRLNEILAGASLAWLFHGPHSFRLRAVLANLHPAIPFTLLLAASLPALGWPEYLRPYAAVALIGTTFFRPGTPGTRLLESKPLLFLAGISYALYVWHPLFAHGWFGTGTALVRYEKRPLGLVLTFAVAWLSTHYFESRFIALGKRLTRPRGSA